MPMQNVEEEPTMEADVSPHAVLEDAGIAFDPSAQHLGLSKEEKRRTTALMLAIQGYRELIIKDAEYLKEMHNEARRENGSVIRPATIDAMVEAAIKFDMFIAGSFDLAGDPQARGGSQTEEAPLTNA